MENPSPLEKDVRPWGRYEVLLEDPSFKVKRIEVNPGARFSLQKHARRAEKWVVVAGEGQVTLGSGTMTVARGSVVEIGMGQFHRMENTGPAPLVFMEVQLGDYFGEDDIVRLSDDYGRR